MKIQRGIIGGGEEHGGGGRHGECKHVKAAAGRSQHSSSQNVNLVPLYQAV